MFIASSIPSCLEFLSGNHTSAYKNSESKVFKNIKFLGEILDYWPNDLFWTNIYKYILLNLADSDCWQYYND